MADELGYYHIEKIESKKNSRRFDDPEAYNYMDPSSR